MQHHLLHESESTSTLSQVTCQREGDIDPYSLQNIVRNCSAESEAGVFVANSYRLSLSAIKVLHVVKFRSRLRCRNHMA